MNCPQCKAGDLETGVASCPHCGFAFPRLTTTAVPRTEELEDTIRRQLVREFRVERLLGRGGMSLVYLAREPELSRQVAVKVLPLQLSFDESAIDRFKREAKIAASLDHPHIVPVFRVGATPAFLWYSMKYVKGRSLRDLIEHTGKLDLESTLDVVEQIAGALNYAHRRGVIHRDVKPSNVMIDQDGWVTVCDFGVAKAFGALPLTQTGSALGTPAYMSPEQCFGKALDGRSDQYALAAVTFECLAGRPPFKAESIGEYVHLHCSVVPPKLTELNPDVAESVSVAIDKALSKNPEDRFADVVDFVRAIGGRIGRRPLPAITMEPPEISTGQVTPETMPPMTHEGRAHVWQRARRAGTFAIVGAILVIIVLAMPSGGARLPEPATTVPIDSVSDAARSQERSATLGNNQRQERPTASNPAQSPPPAAASRSEPQPINAGTLRISTVPLGTLFIDGRRIGQSYTPQGIPVAPGSHTIRVELEGYHPYENTIEVAPGQDIRLTRIPLERK